MPVLEIICGQRTCFTRQNQVVNGRMVKRFKPCAWYRSRGLYDPDALCVLFRKYDLRIRVTGEHHFAVRCEKCLSAERMFSQVRANATAVITDMHKTMRDGLASLVAAQERLSETVQTKECKRRG